MIRQISLTLMLCLGLLACGQKGDLYLPDEKQEQKQQSEQQETQPQSK